MILFFILLLAFLNTAMFHFLSFPPSYYQLNSYTWETEEFRSMKLGNSVAEGAVPDYEQIAALMLEHDFDLTSLRDRSYHNQMLLTEKPEDYRKLANAYKIVLEDLKYFPIPDSTRADTPKPVYSDSWNEKRTYGGDRRHEGCDIMGTERERGFYPVVSISDGVV